MSDLIGERNPFFIAESERIKGLFHVIKPDSRLLTRRGLILEKRGCDFYGVHFVLTLTGRKKEIFPCCAGGEVFDLPEHRLQLSWVFPKSLDFPANGRKSFFRKHFGVLGVLFHVSARSYEYSHKKTYFRLMIN